MRTKSVAVSTLILLTIVGIFCGYGCIKGNQKNLYNSSEKFDRHQTKTSSQVFTDNPVTQKLIAGSHISLTFEFRNNTVYFPANLGGSQVTCILDTGNGIAKTPDKFLKKYKDTFSTSSFATFGSTLSNNNKVVLSDLIISGNNAKYLVQNIPTIVCEPPNNKQIAWNNDFPLIGNRAFDLHVLTIDYPGRIIQINNKFSPKSLSNVGTRPYSSLSIRWQVNAMQSRYPIVLVNIKGQAYRMLLDTGSSITVLELDDASIQSIYQGVKKKNALYKTSNSNISGFVALDTNVVIGRKSVYTDVFVAKRQKLPYKRFFDGILGSDVLRHFRVTIDYPNSKLYLE